MSYNILFNFIKKYCHKLENNFVIDYKENSKGLAYYFINLLNNKEKQIKFDTEKHQYRLQEHHISIYKVEKNYNSIFGSQYHYTALFHDEELSEYKLHVYFNGNDELITDPDFRIIKKQNVTDEYIIETGLDEDFIRLAETQIKPIISQLREKYTEEMYKLEETYKRLEKNARNLSRSLSDNRNEYLISLTEIDKVLSQINSLVRHSYYVQIHTFIRFLKEKVEQCNMEKPQDKFTKLTKSVGENKTKTNKSIYKQKLFDQKTTKAKIAQMNMSLSSFEKEFTVISKAYSSLTEIQEQNVRCEKLADLHESIQRLLSITAPEKINFSSLKLLKTLHENILAAGEKELHNIDSVAIFETPFGTSKSPKGTKIVDKYACGSPGRPAYACYDTTRCHNFTSTNDLSTVLWALYFAFGKTSGTTVYQGLSASLLRRFLGRQRLKKEIFNSSQENINLAKTLSAFHYILNKNYLNEALQNRNSALLDFLLSTNLFTINNQPLTIDKKTYLSAVHYCFNHDKKNKSMVNCLAVLIKRGADIHVADETGVPLSHILLSTEHSLNSALKSNSELINSVSFYNQLIQNLVYYRNNNTLNEEQEKLINAWLNDSVAIFETPFGTSKSPKGTKIVDKYACGSPRRPAYARYDTTRCHNFTSTNDLSTVLWALYFAFGKTSGTTVYQGLSASLLRRFLGRQRLNYYQILRNL